MTKTKTPPTPIPTGKGSRSAADPTLSEYIDKSLHIPILNLPQHVNRFKPEEISYESVLRREKSSVERLLRSGRQFGVFRIVDHGISSEEVRLGLGSSDRIFGLTIECCSSYGEHEKLVWSCDDDHIVDEVKAVIGDQNFRVFRQRMELVSIQLEVIAEELSKVLTQNGRNHLSQEPVQIGESTLSIYRYHRANITSSVTEETKQKSGPYALSLHLVLEAGEFCLPPGRGSLSFDTSSDTIIVTIGKELEEWSHGEFKSAQGKLMFKPFLHTNTPSFSIEQRWSSASNLKSTVMTESNKIITLTDQIMILLLVTLLYNVFVYIYYS